MKLLDGFIAVTGLVCYMLKVIFVKRGGGAEGFELIKKNYYCTK